MNRTRIKICGITRAEDLHVAVSHGADALGFVFYPPSPRFLEDGPAAALASLVPPFVARVGLFVNADAAYVRSTLAAVPLDLLQFHGDEDADYCEQFNLPYLKAARVRAGFDLVEYAKSFPKARAILLDAYVESYGGAGKTFDWSTIPNVLPLPVILSGGLTPTNVASAIAAIRPAAVDVSSGVESAKGIKDAEKIAAFVAGVRNADA